MIRSNILFFSLSTKTLFVHVVIISRLYLSNNFVHQPAGSWWPWDFLVLLPYGSTNSWVCRFLMSFVVILIYEHFITFWLPLACTLFPQKWSNKLDNHNLSVLQLPGIPLQHLGSLLNAKILSSLLAHSFAPNSKESTFYLFAEHTKYKRILLEICYCTLDTFS